MCPMSMLVKVADLEERWQRIPSSSQPQSLTRHCGHQKASWRWCKVARWQTVCSYVHAAAAVLRGSKRSWAGVYSNHKNVILIKTLLIFKISISRLLMIMSQLLRLFLLPLQTAKLILSLDTIKDSLGVWIMFANALWRHQQKWMLAFTWTLQSTVQHSMVLKIMETVIGLGYPEDRKFKYSKPFYLHFKTDTSMMTTTIFALQCFPRL